MTLTREYLVEKFRVIRYLVDSEKDKRLKKIKRQIQEHCFQEAEIDLERLLNEFMKEKMGEIIR